MAMDVPGISRPVLVVLIVAAVLLFAFGATKAVGLLTERTDTQTRTLAAAPTIVVHHRDRRRSDRRGGPHRRAPDHEGEALDLGRRPRQGERRRRRPAPQGPLRRLLVVDDDCGVDSILEVPRATSVRVVTGTGDLRAENLQGDAELRAGTGDLRAIGVQRAAAAQLADR